MTETPIYDWRKINRECAKREYLEKSQQTNKELVDYDTIKKQDDTRKRVRKIISY
jgi:hypothetical protein